MSDNHDAHQDASDAFEASFKNTPSVNTPPAPQKPDIVFEVSENIALIEFSHGKVNAFDTALCEALMTAIHKANSHDTINAILISGQETCFSAGFNLKELTSINTAAPVLGKGIDLLLTMLESPKPIIAAACGHAIALGSMLLLASDYRVGSLNHTFGLNEVALGLPMPYFGKVLAKSRLDNKAWVHCITHGELMKGEEALRVGFLDEVVDNDSVVDFAFKNAQRLAKLPRVAYSETKKDMNKPLIASIRQNKANDKTLLEHAIKQGLLA